MKMEENKLNQAFDQICEAENLSREQLDTFFVGLMEKTETQILRGRKTPNHLTVLSRSLRAVAAVFLLVVSGILMMSCSRNFYWPASKEMPSNAFEMERGDMLVH